MDNWLLSNEDEVDQEELEVALYSQIHFDTATVTENKTTTAVSSSKYGSDSVFAQPSFQVKVRNYTRKKTKDSTVKKVVPAKPPVYDLDFISLSSVVDNKENPDGDSDGCDDNDNNDNISPDNRLSSVTDHPSEGTSLKSVKDSNTCDSRSTEPLSEDDEEDKTPREEKLVSEPQHLIFSSSDNEDEVHPLENTVSDPSVIICESCSPSQIIISDSESDTDATDPKEIHPKTVVLNYQRDSDVSDNENDDRDHEKRPLTTKQSKDNRDSESEGGNRDSDHGDKIQPDATDTPKGGSGSRAVEAMQTGLDAAGNDNEQEEETRDNEEMRDDESMEEESEIEDDSASETRYAEKSAEMDAVPIPMEEPESKWALDERDRLGSMIAVNRYFNPNKIRCRNCNEEGHLALFCTKEKKITCIFCGLQGHRHFDCPQAVCFKCCSPGHKPADCTDARRNRYIECYRCWVKGHMGRACPDMWRQYHETVGLNSERIVKPCCEPNPRVYCYNCGHKGHYGYECDSERMSPYIYSCYPFVAEYDKGRIGRDDSHRRDSRKERTEDNYGRRERFEEMQEDDYDRRGKHREKQGRRHDNDHKRDKYGEFQDVDFHRSDRHDDDRYHRNEKYRESQDASSHKKEKHKRKKDKSRGKDKQKGKQDNSSYTNEELEGLHDNQSQNIKQHKNVSHERDQDKGKKETSAHKKPADGSDKLKSNDSLQPNKKHDEKQAGKKRKAEEFDVAERTVSKRRKGDATMDELEDLRIHVHQGGPRASTVSSEPSSSKRKKKKMKEKCLPDPFYSGSSQFRYQEPTHSKYSEIPNSFDSSFNLEMSVNDRYRRYEQGHWFERHDEKQGHQKSKGKAKHKIDYIREEGEIEDSSDDMMLFESFKPSAKRKRKHAKRQHGKRRHSPLSFIGLMD